MELSNESSHRNIGIDRLKGLIVFCMIFFTVCSFFPCLGFISRFTSIGDNVVYLFDGFPAGDIASTVFIFVIALTFAPSFNKRYEKNKLMAYHHMVTRNLIFLGLGSMMVTLEVVFINGEMEEDFIYTFFCFLILALGVIYLFLKIVFPKNEKLIKIISTIMLVSTCALGIIDLIHQIVIQCIFFSGNFIYRCDKHWAVLSMIGLTGLLSLLFVKLPLKNKIIAFYLLFIGYAIIQSIGYNLFAFGIVVLGGAIGCWGWALISLCGMIFYDIYVNHKIKDYVFFLISMIAIAILSLIFLPINSDSVSANYVAFACAFNGIIFLFFTFNGKFKHKFDFFVWWGRNPLVIFLSGILLKGIAWIIDLPSNLPLWVAIPSVSLVVIGYTLFGYLLYKKNIIIKF